MAENHVQQLLRRSGRCSLLGLNLRDVFFVWQGLFGVTSHPSKAFLLQVDALFRVVASRGMLLSQRKSFDVAIGPYYFGTTAAEQFFVADPGFACAAAQPPADGHHPDP